MPPRKQPGKGIVVVLDVGPGMRAGTGETFYKQAKECLVNILQRKIYADKCRDEVGVVLFGTDSTDNKLANGNQYQNITVMYEPKCVSWDMFTEVEKIPYGSTSADWLDAVVVAMDLLHDPSEDRFSGKKIVLFTDFSGQFSDDQTSNIIGGLKNQGIEFSIIGPDLDEDDEEQEEENNDLDKPSTSNGITSKKRSRGIPQNWNGKPKSRIQLAGEALGRRIIEEVEGMSCSMEEAIPQLMCFEKMSAGSANWNTVLNIGPDFQIAITGKIKVKQATIPTWRTKYVEDESAVIIKEVSYHRQDDAQTVVPAEEVIPGYKYGTSLVPFSDQDAQMKYQSNSVRGLSVLGITPASCVPPSRRAGDQVLVITGRESDEIAGVALSSFIQALAEMDMVAITRRIYQKNSNPILGTLFPEITDQYECLIWIPLPYQEDVRLFHFPSLQLTTKKLNEDEKQAVDDFASAMDLSNQEEEGEEELDPASVLNPQLQHYFNVLTHRALHPHAPVPIPAPHILSILEPRERDIKTDDLKKYFPTRKIIKKSKKDREDVFAESTSDDQPQKVTADTGGAVSVLPEVTKITSATPVQDFEALLRGEAPNFNHICAQLGEVILQLVESLGSGGGAADVALMNKVLQCLKAFHCESACIDPAPYNSFIVKLKRDVVLQHLLALWDLVKDGGLGLISTEENGRSTVSKSEAEKFLELVQEQEEAAPEPPPPSDDMEDLLDDF